MFEQKTHFWLQTPLSEHMSWVHIFVTLLGWVLQYPTCSISVKHSWSWTVILINTNEFLNFSGRGKNKDKCMFLLYLHGNSVVNAKGSSSKQRSKEGSHSSGPAMDFSMKELYAIQVSSTTCHFLFSFLFCPLKQSVLWVLLVQCTHLYCVLCIDSRF